MVKRCYYGPHARVRDLEICVTKRASIIKSHSPQVYVVHTLLSSPVEANKIHDFLALNMCSRVLNALNISDRFIV